MNRDITRCRILQSIGGSGAATITIPQAVSAKNSSTDVVKLKGNDANKISQRAFNHGDSRALLSKFGIELDDLYRYNVYKVDTNEYSLIADIDSNVFAESAAFSWTNSSKVDHRASIGHIDTDERIEKYYYPERGSIKIEKEELQTDSSELTTNNNNNLDPGGGGGGGECLYLSRVCSDVEWTCVADTLITYGACVGAVIPAIRYAAAALCVADIGNSLLQAHRDVGCSMCTDTDTQVINVCGDGWDIQPPYRGITNRNLYVIYAREPI